MSRNMLNLIFSTLLAATAQGQQYQVLHNFLLAPGNPRAGLIEGSDGHFYGSISPLL